MLLDAEMEGQEGLGPHDSTERTSRPSPPPEPTRLTALQKSCTGNRRCPVIHYTLSGVCAS